MITTQVEVRPQNPLVHAGQTIWANLPLLLTIGIAAVVIAIPSMILAWSGIWLLVPPVAALTLGATWTGFTAISHRLINSEPVSIKRSFDVIRQHAKLGIQISLVPALVIASTVGIIQMFDSAESGIWLLGPLALDAIAFVLVLLAWPTIYSLAVERRSASRETWIAALTLAGHSPILIIGSLTLVAMASATVASFAPILLLVLVGPTAIIFSVVYNESIGRRNG